mmetsp:Transcript_5338/g.8770  ORF Transcript_5338/g.8770 Transcript_5338/m.8770 type:complete len:109 (-) Transcript_5338:1-327(-)
MNHADEKNPVYDVLGVWFLLIPTFPPLSLYTLPPPLPVPTYIPVAELLDRNSLSNFLLQPPPNYNYCCKLLSTATTSRCYRAHECTVLPTPRHRKHLHLAVHALGNGS